MIIIMRMTQTRGHKNKDLDFIFIKFTLKFAKEPFLTYKKKLKILKTVFN